MRRRHLWLGLMATVASCQTQRHSSQRVSPASKGHIVKPVIVSSTPEHQAPTWVNTAPTRIASTEVPDEAHETLIDSGSASWYGPKYAGKPTASGEKFNPRDMTAAHKKLPFGTRVKVERMDNGASVVVRINDRGPFTKKRIIDVSQAAAEKLGMVKEGVVKVRIYKITE